MFRNYSSFIQNMNFLELSGKLVVKSKPPPQGCSSLEVVELHS